MQITNVDEIKLELRDVEETAVYTNLLPSLIVLLPLYLGHL